MRAKSKLWVVGLAVAALTTGGAVATVQSASADAGQPYQFKWSGTKTCDGSTKVYRYTVYSAEGDTQDSFREQRFLAGGNEGPNPGDLSIGDVTRTKVRDSANHRWVWRYTGSMRTTSAGYVWADVQGWGLHIDFRDAVCPGGTQRTSGRNPA